MCIDILENVLLNCSNYDSALNMPDHLTFSTGFEDAWGSKYATVLNSATVIIVTNAQFIRPGYLLPFYLF